MKKRTKESIPKAIDHYFCASCENHFFLFSPPEYPPKLQYIKNTMLLLYILVKNQKEKG